MTLRTTPLNAAHRALGARMVEFGGFDMPVQYAGLLEEHAAVRTAAGVFDVSHMGEVELRGPHALDVLQSLVTNDLAKCKDGQAQYSCMCLESGGIVDDIVVYRFSADRLFVCVNASNREKDFAHLHGQARGRCEVVDRGEEFAQLAVQGPKAAAIVQRLADMPLAGIKRYWFTEGKVADVPCIIARTGYTGEDGFELFCDAAHAVKLWHAVLAEGVVPCGLGARDTLRLEAAYRLYGNDMDEKTTPLEAGLDWVVKFEKGDFLGRSAMLGQKSMGLRRRLAGFELTDKGVPRHGYKVVSESREVGEVTSGTLSPTLKKPIGLAYVPSDLAMEGTTLAIDIRGRPARATVVKTPFYKAT